MLIYVAHPFRGDETENLANAILWIKWLIEHSEWAIESSWIVYCLAQESTPANHERQIKDGCDLLARCDAIVLCGGELSDGMKIEMNLANRLGKRIVSLINLGRTPPTLPAEEARELLRKRLYDG